MNKKQAADFLGISPRTLEYHQKKKRISVRYERGLTGDEAVYDESEVRKLKALLDKPTRATSAAVDQSPEPSQSLTTLRGSGAMVSAALPEAIMQIISQSQNAAASVLQLHEKAILSVAEAAQFGVSQKELYEAIHAGKLKARKRRGWRIKRVDLDAFIKKL
jgi:excisionase family DNA binding protein